MRAGEQEFFTRLVDVTNVDRVVFPEVGLTKGDLVGYYARVAETMLAHARDRPVALKRFPRGLDGGGFFQKNAAAHYPPWLRRLSIPKREGGELDHVVADEPATFVYLADQGTIEFHPWLSTAEDVERPVELVLDLDPPRDATVEVVRRATRYVRALLDDLEVPSRLKTSGSAGFHVHVPLQPPSGWGPARSLARLLASTLAARHPDELTVEHHVAQRGGRVFVDWLRNGYGQTSVAAYSVRAHPSAPVATPIGWDELGSAEPRRYTVRNLFRRLGQKADPWAEPIPPQSVDDLRDRLLAVGGDR
jgi:bifunctional non-homologous end joining protein LigD